MVFLDIQRKKSRKEILKKYDENTFNSIRFNQGLSELDGLQVDVYEDKTGYQNGEKIFNFEYRKSRKLHEVIAIY